MQIRVYPQPKRDGTTADGVPRWCWCPKCEGRSVMFLWCGNEPFSLIYDYAREAGAPPNSVMVLRGGVWMWSDTEYLA